MGDGILLKYRQHNETYIVYVYLIMQSPSLSYAQIAAFGWNWCCDEVDDVIWNYQRNRSSSYVLFDLVRACVPMWVIDYADRDITYWESTEKYLFEESPSQM